MSKHDAIGVGIVMNARGVTELVAASIAFHAALARNREQRSTGNTSRGTSSPAAL